MGDDIVLLCGATIQSSLFATNLDVLSTNFKALLPKNGVAISRMDIHSQRIEI
jgi:hypothetical protein